MFKWIVGLGIGLIVLFLAVSFSLPAEIAVSDTVTVAAPPEKVRLFIADLRQWPEWTQLNASNDKTVTWTYSGPPSGPGSVAEWKGKELGSGKLEILGEDPQQGIHFRVASQSHAPAEGYLKVHPAPEGSSVTWSMSQHVNPFLRLFATGMKSAQQDELHSQLTKLSEVAAK